MSTIDKYLNAIDRPLDEAGRTDLMGDPGSFTRTVCSGAAMLLSISRKYGLPIDKVIEITGNTAKIFAGEIKPLADRENCVYDGKKVRNSKARR